MQRALHIAYRYLNQRERTRTEVRDRLAHDGIERAAIEETIVKLTEQGLLDDARFVRLFIEDKRQLQEWGAERIKRALVERGIDSDVAEQALRKDDDAGTEFERALRLLRRRFPAPPQSRRERDRALAMMLRKGYDSELALEVLTAYARDDKDADLG